MSEWISVNERLPEFDQDVLVYHKDWGIEISYRTRYVDFLDIGIIDGGKATHWKPLPNPPGEHSGDEVQDQTEGKL